MQSDMPEHDKLIGAYRELADIVLDSQGKLGVQLAETARDLDGLINGLGVSRRLLEARMHIRAALLLVTPVVERIDKL
jgi:hypothetical protein